MRYWAGLPWSSMTRATCAMASASASALRSRACAAPSAARMADCFWPSARVTAACFSPPAARAGARLFPLAARDGSLFVALGLEDKRAARPLGRHLLLHRDAHVLGRVDVLHVHTRDLHAPLVRRFVEPDAELRIKLVALRQRVV